MLPSTICSGANGQEPYNHGGAATSVVVGSSNGFMVRIEIGQNGLMDLVNDLKWINFGLLAFWAFYDLVIDLVNVVFEAYRFISNEASLILQVPRSGSDPFKMYQNHVSRRDFGSTQTSAFQPVVRKPSLDHLDFSNPSTSSPELPPKREYRSLSSDNTSMFNYHHIAKGKKSNMFWHVETCTWRYFFFCRGTIYFNGWYCVQQSTKFWRLRSHTSFIKIQIRFKVGFNFIARLSVILQTKEAICLQVL